MTASIQMPKYKCHKEVWALKIIARSDITDDGGLRLFFQTPYAPIDVDSKFVDRMNLNQDGYYVVYKDGYQSWSPADAFEEGYTLVNEG